MFPFVVTEEQRSFYLIVVALYVLTVHLSVSNMLSPRLQFPFYWAILVHNTPVPWNTLDRLLGLYVTSLFPFE